MKVAVLGTGMVGQAHAGKLTELGHDVIIGTHDPKDTLFRMEDGQMTEAYGKWIKKYPKVRTETFTVSSEEGEIIFNALNAQGALSVLKPIKEQLEGKVLIDITNPLDFSSGDLRLTVSNDNSMGEEIQKALPKTKVVKAFNTTNAAVQTNPKAVGGGDHHLFVAGNDSKAKQEVIKIAKDWYGWKHIIDLGDIKSARNMEMMLPLWVNLFGVLKTPLFNYKIVQ